MNDDVVITVVVAGGSESASQLKVVGEQVGYVGESAAGSADSMKLAAASMTNMTATGSNLTKVSSETAAGLLRVADGADVASVSTARAAGAMDVAGASGMKVSTTYDGMAAAAAGATKKTDELDEHMAKVTKTSGGFMSGMSGLIAALGLFEVGKTGLTAIKDQQVAMEETRAIIRATGDAYHITAGQVASYAVQQSRLTGFKKAEVQESENLLLSTNKVGEGYDHMFRRTTEAAEDLARGPFHTTLPSAMKALTVAMDEPEKGLTRLSRAGIVFSKEQKEMIVGWVQNNEVAKAQDYILAAVEGRVKGVAAAYGNTLSGQVDRAKVGFEELAESLTKLVLPTALELVHVGMAVLGWLTALPLETKKTILTLLGLVGVFLLMAKAIIRVREVSLALKEAWVENPEMLALMALVTIAVLVIEHWSRVREVFVGIGSFFSRLGSEILAEGKRIGEAILYPFEWAFAKIKSLVNTALHIPVLGTALKIGFDLSPVGIGKAVAGLVGLAGGGTVIQPGAFVVGERGPEVVNLPRGSAVTPMGAQQQSGWGNGDIVIKIDAKTLARVNRRQMLQSQAAGA